MDLPVASAYTYASLLQVCTHIKSLKQIHARIIIKRLDQNIFLAARLLINYAICSCPDDARLVFDKIYRRDGFLWNSMIRVYAGNGHYEEILTLYNQMRQDGLHPDNFTFPFVLKACASLSAPREGKATHSHVLRSGFDLDVHVGNALIDMYGKCGRVENACQVFEEMSVRDVVSWTAMIVGYAQNGRGNDALVLFNQMLTENAKPDSVTMASVLQACTHLGALQQGKWIHRHVISSGFEPDVFVRAGLIDMYANCGNIEDARRVFDKMLERDVVLWNAMIKGYFENGFVDDGLTLFNEMKNSDVKPNSVTMLTVLPACALQQGKRIHGYVLKNRLESDVSVSNCLIAMYGRCGNIEVARQLFDKMSKTNVVSWNAMIAAYTQDGYANEALTLFNQMQLAHIKPDLVTMVSALSACAQLGALQQGKWIHDDINRNGFGSDVSVGTALIDMYAKCGNVEAARQVFDSMFKRSVVTWSAMIDGYGIHGQGEEALALFSQMQEAGMKPNYITFICVLSACSHAGLVDEGLQYFHSMSRDYCITPNVKHYACIVDLLGRAGRLNEAQDFITKMPIEPNVGVWGALLGACRIHCNAELAENVAKHLFALDPEHAGYYVLLSNIFAAADRWDGVSKARKLIKDMGLKTTPGSSFIEINNRVHTFLMGDKSCPQYEKVYAMLETLAGQMEEAGYVPDTKFVLHDVKEEVKEEAGCCFWVYQNKQWLPHKDHEQPSHVW